jgi:hypothetical protein
MHCSWLCHAVMLQVLCFAEELEQMLACKEADLQHALQLSLSPDPELSTTVLTFSAMLNLPSSCQQPASLHVKLSTMGSFSMLNPNLPSSHRQSAPLHMPQT